MKKLFTIIPVLAVFVACNNNYPQPSDDFASTLSETSTPQYSSPKDAAPEIARAFVKREFSSNCNFEGDVVLDNTMVTNRYQVMQKFKSNSQEYVYKIFIQYFDGDVNDASSWEFDQLVVEEVGNGKQTHFKGSLDSRIKRSVGIGETVEFNGIQFKVKDARIGTSIEFSHKGTLTRNQLAGALKEMHETYGYDVYNIYRENKLDEDYFSYHATGNMSGVFDYEHNKIYESLDAYIQGKAIN